MRYFFTSQYQDRQVGIEYSEPVEMVEFLRAMPELRQTWFTKHMENIAGLLSWHDYASAREALEMLIDIIKILDDEQGTDKFRRERQVVS